MTTLLLIKFFNNYILIMPSSSSTSASQQYANALISQQFSGNCNISCTQVQQGVSINLIDSNVGGSVDFTQQCNVNGQCMISSTMNATSDVAFKASNSSNATDAGLFQRDSGSSTGLQDIQQQVFQNSTQNCNVSSVQQMSDMTLFALNSNIQGNVAVGQSSSVNGSCALNNSMGAATIATGAISNTSSSGKDKIGQKKKGFYGTLTTIGIGLVVVFGVFIFAKMLIPQKSSSTCPGGMTPIPIKGKNGKPTKKMECPPYTPQVIAAPASNPVNIIMNSYDGGKTIDNVKW